jgi:hypothetical protein
MSKHRLAIYKFPPIVVSMPIAHTPRKSKRALRSVFLKAAEFQSMRILAYRQELTDEQEALCTELSLWDMPSQYSCNTISRICVKLFGGFGTNSPEHELYNAYFKPENCNDGDSWWSDVMVVNGILQPASLEENNNERVLALLFMAEICRR